MTTETSVAFTLLAASASVQACVDALILPNCAADLTRAMRVEWDRSQRFRA